MKNTRRAFILGAGGLTLVACKKAREIQSQGQPATEHIIDNIKVEQFDPRLKNILDEGLTSEVLSTGHQWLEGPAWDKKRECLYFTDVPVNKAYVWSRSKSVSIFQNPSGVDKAQAQGFREPGANGLFYTHDGKLIICNHGRRIVEVMDLDTLNRVPLVQSYKEKKFNSPNDIVQAVNGTFYFTDPPYGLEGLNESPLKDMRVNGVYKAASDGGVERLVEDMTFPNGIALSPDEDWLYISQSDPDAPLIRRINLVDPSKDEVWFDAAPYMADGPGLPDGMAVTKTGYVFASGPTGIFIIHPSGDVMGRLNTGRACANCTFGEDGSTLFITAQDRLLKLKTRVKGLYS